MRIFFLILIVLLGCNKPNTETNSSSGNSEVTQISNEQNHSREYKKGEAIELYDLVYMFLPEEGSNDKIINWSETEKLDAKWEEMHCWEGKCIQDGNIKVTQNGKIQDYWYASFVGKENSSGFTSFGAYFSFLTYTQDIEINCEESLNLDYIFPSKNYTANIIESNDCDAGVGYKYFEIKFPSKNTVWMSLEYSSGSRQGDYGFKVYFNKDDLEKY